MDISVSRPIFFQKHTKVSMVQLYPYSARWQGVIVFIIDIYGDRFIPLPFFVRQDN